MWTRSKTRKSRKPRKKQLNKVIALSTTKEINKQNPFDIAWEEKTKKIRIFRNFRVFILSPTPKNKNSEITDILQKSYNTEM